MSRKEVFTELKNIVKNRFHPPLLFRLGDPKKECEQCEKIRVFMACVGMISVEQRRMTFPKDATLREVRQNFGRDMDQEGMFDENYYRFNDSELGQSIYNFSNGCALNVIFQHPEMNDSWRSIMKKKGLKSTSKL